MERLRRVAERVAEAAADGERVAVVVSAMAGKTNELVAWTDGAGAAAAPTRVVRRRVRRGGRFGRTGHRRPPGHVPAQPWACGRDRGWDGRCRSSPTMRTAEPASTRFRPTLLDARWTQRRGGGDRRLPGRHPRGAARHARPRRLGHHRRGDRRGHRGAALRHLYRCGWRLHHRSPDRGWRAAGSTRSATKRCWRWPRSAPRCCTPARSNWPWPTRVPVRVSVELHRAGRGSGGRHPRLRRGGNHGKTDRQRRGLQPRRGEDQPVRTARSSRRVVGNLRPPGRRGRQRRHDRPEPRPRRWRRQHGVHRRQARRRGRRSGSWSRPSR